MFTKSISSKKKAACIVMGLVFVLVASSSNAVEKTPKPINLKFSAFITLKQPSGPPMVKACQMLEKASGGKVKINIYWSEALGKAPEQLDVAREGIADMVWYCAIYTPARFPLSLFVELPFFSRNAQIATKVLEELVKRKLITNEFPPEIKRIAVHALPPSHLVSKNKLIMSVDDFKGMRIWGYGPVWTKTWSLLGATTVGIGWQDIYLALERGTIDAAVSHWSGSAGAKWYEVAKYPTDIGIMGGFSSGVLMNTKAWDKLPSDVQAAWAKLSQSNEIGTMWAQMVDEKEEAGKQAWRAAGRKIYEMPLPEKEKIAEKLTAVWQQWIDTNEAAGKPAKEIYKTYVEVMKKLGEPVLMKLPGLYR